MDFYALIRTRTNYQFVGDEEFSFESEEIVGVFDSKVKAQEAFISLVANGSRDHFEIREPIVEDGFKIEIKALVDPSEDLFESLFGSNLELDHLDLNAKAVSLGSWACPAVSSGKSEFRERFSKQKSGKIRIWLEAEGTSLVDVRQQALAAASKLRADLGL